MLGKPGIRVRIPIRRVVLEPTQERVVGTDEKLQASLAFGPETTRFPYLSEDKIIAPGILNNLYLRHSALYMRY